MPHIIKTEEKKSQMQILHKYEENKGISEANCYPKSKGHWTDVGCSRPTNGCRRLTMVNISLMNFCIVLLIVLRNQIV